MIYLPDETLPIPLYDALVHSDKEYFNEVRDFLSDKDFEYPISVTSLGTPTQAAILMARHNDDIYIRPMPDAWHSLMGNVIHFVLEKHAANNPRFISEARYGVNIKVDGVTCYVHGKFDLYDIQTKTLQDWKLTSAKNMIYPKTKFEIQLNVLKFILERNDIEVEHLENHYLFPHLDKAMANNPNYPKTNSLTIPVPIMPEKEVIRYIRERLRARLTERDKMDHELTPCTDDERWVRDKFYAVHERVKAGRKGEVKPFSTRAAFKTPYKAEAVAYRKQKGLEKEDVQYILHPGTAKGCDYCKARSVCRQYLNSIKPN